MGENFEQLLTVEMLDGFGKLAALLQRADKIRPGLGSASRKGILWVLHGCVLRSYKLIRSGRWSMCRVSCSNA